MWEVFMLKRISVFFTVFPLLISLLLFSVGFASWTAVVPVSDAYTQEIGMSVDNVYYSTDYIKVKKIDLFKYTSFHFLDSSDQASDVGYITVKCEIDLGACKMRLEEKGKSWDGTLDLSLALLCRHLRSLRFSAQ